VRVVCGWSAEWEWQGRTIARRGVDSGTGFLVHPDGYVLTAARVVVGLKESDEHVRTTAGIDILEAILASAGRPSTTEDVRVLMVEIAAGATPEPRLVRLQRVRWVYLQDGRRYPFTIRAFGAPSACRGGRALSANDAAVLKIDIGNAPTLAPAETDLAGPGLTVRIMTLPELGESEDLEPKSAPFAPAPAADSIAAREAAPDGRPILRTAGAALPPAASGGPVLDEQGRVVGLLVSCHPGAGGREADGFQFVVPIRTALELVRQAGAEVKAGGKGPGATTAAGGAPAAGKTAGEAEGGLGRSALIGLIAGGAAFLVLVIVVVAVAAGRRRAPAAAAYPPPAPPAFAPQGPPYAAPIPVPPGLPAGLPPGPPLPPAPSPVPPPAMPAPAPPVIQPAAAPSTARTEPVAAVAAPVVAKTEPVAAVAAPVVARTEPVPVPTVPRLICTAGPLEGREFPIGQGLVVGRDAARAQVVVADPQVSSRHVWVGPAGGRIVARDQGSANGTFLNGRMEQRITEAPLGEGDTLILGVRGTVRFVFRA
jgi:S1-C subfamily serine protease